MMRAVRWTALGLIAALACVWAVLLLARAHPSGVAAQILDALAQPGSGHLSVGDSIGAFDLIDTHGDRVTNATFRTKWCLVAFGSVGSPFQTPAALQAIAQALEDIDPSAETISPILITLEPSSDTPVRLAAYLSLFDAPFVGLSGTPDQINAAAAAFGVYHSTATWFARRNVSAERGYPICLIGPSGRVDAMFSATVDAETMASRIAAITGAAGRKR